MKNLIFIIAIIFIFTTACKKEQLNDKTIMPESQNNTESLILNFKQKLENHLKDATIYDADSSVWYVEALLNYSYGNTANKCTRPLSDTIETIVNCNAELGFTIAQLADVYDLLESGVMEQKPVNSSIFAIDVYAYPAGELTVFAAKAIYNPLSLKSTMDTAGYWYWGLDYGMCGADSGLYVGMDASDILDGLLNYVTSEGYWTDLESFYVFPPQYPDSLFPFNDPILNPSRLFSATSSNWYDLWYYCMSPEQIAYYASKDGIGYIIKDLWPQRKQFFVIDVIPYPLTSYTFHACDITYGIPR